jgi:hypothetical protein
MNRGRVGEERGGKEMDGWPLTAAGFSARAGWLGSGAGLVIDSGALGYSVGTGLLA